MSTSARRFPPLVLLLPLLLSLLHFAPDAAGPAIAGIPSGDLVKLPWTHFGDTPQARFGSIVAPAGDVNGDGYSDVLVSAPKENGPVVDCGRVYLYYGTANGLTPFPQWSWSANQVSGLTGTGTAGAGDVNGDGYGDIVIGTPGWTVGPNANAGKISIFHGSSTGLPTSPNYERFASVAGAQAQFGFAVATAGNVNGDVYDDIIVGEPFHTSGGLAGRGAALVYHGSGTGLGAAPVRTILGAQAGANLGKAVSTAGDVDADGFSDVLIGAPFAVVSGNRCGTAALFRGSGTGVLAVADTVLSSENADEEVGAAVANAGDIDGDGYADVLVGSPGYNNTGLNDGRYMLLRGGPGGLLPDPALVIIGHNEGERLGAALATLGDLNADGYADFAASAPNDSTESPNALVYVHLGSPMAPVPPSGFEQSISLASSSPEARYFGFSIATAGDVDGDGLAEFVVGDPAESVFPDGAEGTAVIYELPRSVPAPMGGYPTSANDPGTLRGASVAISPGPDVSGYAHLLASEPGYDSTGDPDRGYVHIHPGASGGMSDASSGKLGEVGGELFGAQLADAGDIDRDGYSDVLISSPGRSDGPGGAEAGRVWLMSGDAVGGLQDPVPVLDGDQPLAHIGSALSGRGDVDGDGYHDVLIGAREWDGGPGLVDCGKVWLLFGGPTGFRAGVWTAQGTQAGQGLGASVAIGDIDGDAYSDLLIASVSPLLVSPPNGKVAIHYGRVGGPPPAPDWEITGNPSTATFGSGLAAVGDVDNDGVGDIVVGAPSEGAFGRVYLFPGGRGRGKPRVKWALAGTQSGALFGWRIAGNGDVDGDGIADFVVGEPRYDPPGVTDGGRISLFYGTSSVPDFAWTAEGNGTSYNLGSSLATLNDLNNDGFADIAAGAPGQVGVVGRVYLFGGGGRAGLVRALSLETSGGTSLFLYHPIRIGAGETVAVSSILRSAAGRNRVSAQVEVVPHGEPFTGEPTMIVGPFDTGPAAGGTSFFEYIDLPWMGIAYNVRARNHSTSPFFPGSTWVRAESHAGGDFDVYRGGTEVAVPGPAVASVLAPRLGRIAPNPVPTAGGAATLARIAYDLPRATHVVLDVHDVRGGRVRRLVDEVRPAGSSAATWDGRDDRGQLVPAGLYFVRFVAEDAVDRGRLVRLP